MQRSRIVARVLGILLIISFMCIFWEGEKFGVPNLLVILFTSASPPFTGLVYFAAISTIMVFIFIEKLSAKNLLFIIISMLVLISQQLFYKQEVLSSIQRSSFSELTFVIFWVISILFLFAILFTFKIHTRLKNQG